MKAILDIKDSKAPFVLELLGNFSFVKVQPITNEKALLLRELKEAVDTVNLIKQGKNKHALPENCSMKYNVLTIPVFTFEQNFNLQVAATQTADQSSPTRVRKNGENPLPTLRRNSCPLPECPSQLKAKEPARKCEFSMHTA